MRRAMVLSGLAGLLVSSAHASEPNAAAEVGALLTYADRLSKQPEGCAAAAEALRRVDGRCSGALCVVARDTAVAVERRCAASVLLLPEPGDGRLTGPAPALEGRWLRVRRVEITWGDGGRSSRAICPTPTPGGMLVELPRRGDERVVDEDAEGPERALAHQLAGFAHVRAGEACAGAAAFEASYAAAPAPLMLLNVGRAHDQWAGGCLGAADAYQRFVETCPDCAEVDDARARLAEARARCAERPPPPTEVLATPRAPRATPPRTPRPVPRPEEPFPTMRVTLGCAGLLAGAGLIVLDVVDDGSADRSDAYSSNMRGRSAELGVTLAALGALTLISIASDDLADAILSAALASEAGAVQIGPGSVRIRF